MANNKYVWYLSYGATILRKVFMCYIEGGELNNRIFIGCRDKTPPIAERPVIIPRELYFYGNSQTWENKGLAFLKTEHSEENLTLGRMYLIKEEQFDDIWFQEDKNWYDHKISLGEYDGYPLYTVTRQNNGENIVYNAPSKEHLILMIKGLKTTYNDMEESDMIEYIISKEGVSLEYSRQDIENIIYNINYF